MQTLIITKHEDGQFEMSGNVTDVIDRIGLIEAARITARCELIRTYTGAQQTDNAKACGDSSPEDK